MKKKNKNIFLHQQNTYIRIFVIFLICSFISFPAFAQQSKEINGNIKNSVGENLIGASVMLEGTKTGTITDVNGDFKFNVPATGDVSLVASYIGYNTQTISLGNSRTINIVLTENTKVMNEVVVIGYGTQIKRDITGSTSSISSAVITSRPITRLDQALQGTTPGVKVQSNSGQPGQQLSVLIRGTNSITGSNQPLYVIDGQIGGNIESISPEDIQSMEVLKDASSTAIYGSMASNGVILVTTKTGKLGKLKVDANVWTSFASMPKYLDLMNASQFANTVNAANVAVGKTAPFSAAQLATIQQNGPGTDWQKAVTQSATIQNYQLTLSGGTANVKYLFSGNYLDQPGIVINQSYKKATFRSNVDIKASDRLDLRFNITGFESTSRNTDYAGDYTDPFGAASEWDPTTPIKDASGNYILTSKYASTVLNPVAMATNRISDNTTSNFSGIATLNYRILKGLTFTSMVSYMGQYQYTPKIFNSSTGEGFSLQRAEANNSRYHAFQNSNYFTYKTNFGDHALTLTALYEQQQHGNINVLANANGLSTIANGYYNLGLGGTQIISSGYWADALNSFMGRINYSYKDKYLLTASLRDDGSSHLSPDKRYSLFPSLALGWIATNEDFLKNNSVISYLKVRGSYGKTGNQAVPPYATIPLINVSTTSYYFNGTSPSVTTPLGTAVTNSLKWETTDQYDGGIDATLFNGKLTLSVDYYNKKISDLIYNYPAPQYLGGGNYPKNIGSLQNDGVDLGIGGTPVSSGTFKWHTFLTVSFNNNKILDLGGLDNLILNGVGQTQAALSILKIGQPIGTFYGYNFQGTWKSEESDKAKLFGLKPGDAKYEDVNSDNAYTSKDLMVIGNGNPKFSYGFTNDLSFGNFTLSFMFQGEYGKKIFDSGFENLYGGKGYARDATSTEALNMWTPANQTDFPIVGSTSNYTNSSRYVFVASYLKLKNLSLSYDLPYSILKKVNFSKFQLYVSGQNLFCITAYKGYDPETTTAQNAMTQGLQTGSIPNPKTITIGLRASF